MLWWICRLQMRECSWWRVWTLQSVQAGLPVSVPHQMGKYLIYAIIIYDGTFSYSMMMIGWKMGWTTWGKHLPSSQRRLQNRSLPDPSLRKRFFLTTKGPTSFVLFPIDPRILFLFSPNLPWWKNSISKRDGKQWIFFSYSTTSKFIFFHHSHQWIRTLEDIVRWDLVWSYAPAQWTDGIQDICSVSLESLLLWSVFLVCDVMRKMSSLHMKMIK